MFLCISVKFFFMKGFFSINSLLIVVMICDQTILQLAKLCNIFTHTIIIQIYFIRLKYLTVHTVELCVFKLIIIKKIILLTDMSTFLCTQNMCGYSNCYGFYMNRFFSV